MEAYGRTKARVKAKLERKLAWKLLREGIIPHPVPPDEDPNQPSDPDHLNPAQVNPVSLVLREVIQQHGGTEKVSRMTGLKPSSLNRLANPFYWGQSTNTIRQIAEGTCTRITLVFGPDAPRPTTEKTENKETL
ncbi:hypothetical protein [Deinococcus sp. SL84]|uniref:hypothetical protein n=1 Tax=Deinococcus sp. SL84 TaxID=2994663 RepID=UPI0022736879|nr:hypothetical protein [Deinococcus sp. SL84]MCY1703879.1 hypothetical protein [Deinococcus sp. SL84]